MTNITLPRSVVQRALEALESSDESSCDEFLAAIDALREALEQPQQTVCMAEYKRLQDLVTSQGIRLMEYESEQPQQEPEIYQVTAPSNQYRWMAVDAAQYAEYTAHGWIGRKLYTTPPRREWVGLSDAEINDCMSMSIQQTCRAIEAKLKEKNA